LQFWPVADEGYLGQASTFFLPGNPLYRLSTRRVSPFPPQNITFALPLPQAHRSLVHVDSQHSFSGRDPTGHEIKPLPSGQCLCNSKAAPNMLGKHCTTTPF
jgi:hypothetical protein